MNCRSHTTILSFCAYINLDINIFIRFRLCEPIHQTSDLDKWGFYNGMAGNFASIVQYNEIRQGSGVAGLGNVSISKVCALMTEKEASPLEKYAAVNDLILDKVHEEPCADVNYAETTNFFKTEAWESPAVKFSARQWVYQTCTEFGFYQTSNFGKDKPFGYFPLQYSIHQCQDVFGAK